MFNNLIKTAFLELTALISIIRFILSANNIRIKKENIKFKIEMPEQINRRTISKVPINIIIGNAVKITIIGKSKLRKIAYKTNFFNVSLEIGNDSYHSKLFPDIIMVVFVIANRKKLKN